MKTPIKPLLSLFAFLLVSCSLSAQLIWTYAVDYKLRGNIKSLSIVNIYGDTVRKEEFKNHDEQLAFIWREDSIRNSGKISPVMLRAEYEKVYPLIFVTTDSTVKMRFNARGQVLEKQTGTIHEWNTFSDDGKITAHVRNETFSELITDGGVKSRKAKNWIPDYIFSNTLSTVVIFKYNTLGSLLEFEYYNSDADKNVRITNEYDEINNLIESNHYNHENISWKLLKDDYLEKFIHTNIDQMFLMDKYYPDYWCEGTPLKEDWKYDEQNRKIRYVRYDGNKHSLNFESKWFYNKEEIIPASEMQYDISPGGKELKCIIEFDDQGNVAIEKRYLSPWNYLIEYY